MTAEGADLDRIVQEVIRRLAGTPSSNDPAGPADPPAPPPPGTVTITHRVVTLAQLPPVLEAIGQLRVPKNAVITPAVRDTLRQRRIELVRTDLRPAAVAPWVWACSDPAFAPAPLLAAAEPLGMPNQPLPGSDLEELIEGLAARLQETTTRGVLVTRQPFAACCRANRNQNLRAIFAPDVQAVRTGTEQARANLLIVDSQAGAGLAANLVRSFATATATAGGGRNSF